MVSSEGDIRQYTAIADGRIGRLMLALIAAAITLLCFANAIENDFTNWDDPLYVVENELIRSVSARSVREIFTSFLVGNYHPLTVLSLALDYALFGLHPSGYHLTTILLHTCNVLIVFVFIQKLTGSAALSFITALLFGIHPLHVESVAWVSERKDVLYTLFYLCSMYVYLSYIRSVRRKGLLYAASLALFVCSLLSKGQAVTLSVVLLLIDYCEGRRFTRATAVEKVPFFILSLVFGVVAIAAQKDTGAIPDLPTFSLAERIVLACFNLYIYAAKLVAPLQLSAFYPYPVLTRWSSYLVYYLPAVCTAALVIGYRCRLTAMLFADRVVVFGWAFFLINIALLLQVLPVGASMISERYSYLCSLGFFVLIGHGITWLWRHSRPEVRQLRGVFALLLVLYSGWLAYRTIERNKVWQSSEALWNDVLQQFPQVVVAYLNRGSYYQVRGDLDRALADFNAGLAINPNYYDILVNRCDVFRLLGEYERAVADCTKVIDEVGDNTVAFTNRGITYSMLGRYDDALEDFEKAIVLEPKNAKLYTNRGNLYDMTGRYDTAIENYSYAISLRPDYYAAYYNRGKTRMRKYDFAAAIKDFDVAVRSEALAVDSYFYRSQAFAAVGDLKEALDDARTAMQSGRTIDPRYIEELQAGVNR